MDYLLRVKTTFREFHSLAFFHARIWKRKEENLFVFEKAFRATSLDELCSKIRGFFETNCIGTSYRVFLYKTDQALGPVQNPVSWEGLPIIALE